MPRSTDSRKLALWRERLERFSGGEMAVGPFCARERVSVASFYYWREKVGDSEEPSPRRPRTARQSVFQPVTVVPLDTTRTHLRSVAAKPRVASRVPAAAAIRIELPWGTRIEVGTEDLEVVRAVVGVVARSPAGHDGRDGVC